MGIGEALVNRCSGHGDLSGSKTIMGQSQLAMVRPEQAGELESTSGQVAQQLRDNRILLSYWDHMPGGKRGSWLDGRCSKTLSSDIPLPNLTSTFEIAPSGSPVLRNALFFWRPAFLSHHSTCCDVLPSS